MWHDTGTGAGVLAPGGWLQPHQHLEDPEAKRRVRNLLDVSGLLAELVPTEVRAATVEEVGRVHVADYIERIAAISEDPPRSNIGEGTAFGAGSYEIALLSAGGVIGAVDAVLDGVVDNVYALTRPPAHHATPDQAIGGCVFNNLAIAARHAQSRGVERVAIIDWDVHWGNGTQACLYDDPSVLAISLHQDRHMALMGGTVDERGTGEGEGATLNIPLPAGSGQAAYLAALDRVVLPALDEFRPDLIILATGFDACGFDPLARMMLHSEAFRAMATRIIDAAGRLCPGRLVAVHEGGYSPFYAPFCALAVVEVLAGTRTAVEDPYLPFLSGPDQDTLHPHQDAAIAAAAAARMAGGTVR
jgi:acetoin utilization deacetylase AcuC-like enzyme